MRYRDIGPMILLFVLKTLADALAVPLRTELIEAFAAVRKVSAREEDPLETEVDPNP